MMLDYNLDAWLSSFYCFRVGIEKKTWADSQSECNSINGRLVEIDSEELNQNVAGKVYEYEAHSPLRLWIGVTDIESEGRAVKNLKNENLNLSWKFEGFWDLSSKNLNVLNLNYPKNLIHNLKNAVLILTSSFEFLFEDPQ